MKDDTIKREDAIGAINGWLKRNHFPEIGDGILYLVPSADSPHKIIAQITFDEEKLRESVKEAIERFKEEYEIADRPQGEWKPKNHHTDYCSECGFEETQWRTTEYKFCPHCGARMI